jgi:hypothetical protein
MKGIERDTHKRIKRILCVFALPLLDPPLFRLKRLFGSIAIPPPFPERDPTMPRVLKRVMLEAGQRLDINELRRNGTIKLDAGEVAGTFLVSMPKIGFSQRIIFVSRRRHLGGRQFYFECPTTGKKCSVLYRPPGATRFCHRTAWRGQVAYQSQFVEPAQRCHLAMARIARKLGGEAGGACPPKPLWMRWPTYEALRARWDEQQQRLDDALGTAWARLERLG